MKEDLKKQLDKKRIELHKILREQDEKKTLIIKLKKRKNL